MIRNHNEYLNYMLPNNWCAEEDTDNLLLYNPSGNGAITISFFSVLNTEESLDEQISILAKRFIDKNNIKICEDNNIKYFDAFENEDMIGYIINKLNIKIK